MTTPKCLVCTCEDVTDHELCDAIALGYQDIEGIKRYTGLGTGPCQGKTCITLTRRILAETTGADPATLGAITYRPPVRPVPLRFLAGDDMKEADE